MTRNDSRVLPRSDVRRVEVITIYRDRRDLPIEEAAARLLEQRALYDVFNVIAVARDASPLGLGICITGQLRRASNLLRPRQRVILKLSFLPDADDRVGDAGPDGRASLLVKAVCRWFRAGPRTCAAGFELAEANPPVAVERFRRQLLPTDWSSPPRERGPVLFARV